MINTRDTCTGADSFARSCDLVCMVQSHATIKANKSGNAGSYKEQHCGNIQGKGTRKKREKKKLNKMANAISWKTGQRFEDIVSISNLKAVKGVEIKKIMLS